MSVPRRRFKVSNCAMTSDIVPGASQMISILLRNWIAVPLALSALSVATSLAGFPPSHLMGVIRHGHSGPTSVEPLECFDNLPAPELVFEGRVDEPDFDGVVRPRYHFRIDNWEEYPDELFAQAPHLPPCGLNPSASRTWVNFRDKSGNHVYGFCGLRDNEDLNIIWIGASGCPTLHDSVYVSLIDRECGLEYRSQLVSVYHTPLVVSGPAEACPGSEVMLCATATNCSESALDITVTIGGHSQTFRDVAPLAEVMSCALATMPTPDHPESSVVLSAMAIAGPSGIQEIANHIVAPSCEGMFACPRGLGFWRQQCAQRGNGSTKICRSGLEAAFRCLIDATQVERWRSNEGNWLHTEHLRNLSDSDLFGVMCSELEGPRPMSERDVAERHYIALMLNVCAGMLHRDTELSSHPVPTVAELISRIESSLNMGADVGNLVEVIEQVNSRIGLLAAECPDDQAVFGELAECESDGSETTLDTPPSMPSDQGALVIGAPFPSPARGGPVVFQLTVSEQLAGQLLQVSLHDVAGRLVRDLHSELVTPGQVQVYWDLRNDNGQTVPPGLYFCRLVSGSERLSAKVLIVK